MQEKIPDFSASLFIGKNEGYISFGSGQPDLAPPEQVFKKIVDFRAFKYGLIQGELKLRQALAKEYPKAQPDDFVITNGASEALDLVLRSIGQGKILMGRPYYYSYPYLVKYANMTPVYSELVAGRFDLEDFSEKVHGCKAVLINSPSNPTGRVESIKTLKEIEKITRDLGIYVISDEVYKDLIYTRENYMIEGDHVITVNSFSKTYAMCGFRVGYLWSNDNEIVKKVIEMKTHTSMNTNIMGQEMAYEATKVPREYLSKQVNIWKERRDAICEGLTELGFDLWKPEGAFYVLPKPPKGVDPKRFVWEMYTKHKVITYLGEWFGSPKRVRFSYALDTEKIREGLGKIKSFLES